MINIPQDSIFTRFKEIQEENLFNKIHFYKKEFLFNLILIFLKVKFLCLAKINAC